MQAVTKSFRHDLRYCCQHGRMTKARKLKRDAAHRFRQWGRRLVRALIAGEDWIDQPRPATGYDVC